MKKITLLIVVLITNISYSQQLQESSLYMFNALYYNPAYAGTRQTLSATLIQRNQWVGFKGAPTSQFLSVHTPLSKRNLGVGMHVNNDATGSRKLFSAYADLSASVLLTKNEDRLSVGISAGLDNYQMNFASLYTNDPNDPLVTSYSFVKPNVGLGVYYYGKNKYAGLSIPMIIQTNSTINQISSNFNKRHLVLTAGYVFKINSVVDFKPSTLIKYVPGAPLAMDLNASFFAFKKVWLGALVRMSEGVGLNLSYLITNTITVGYAYDYPLNSLRTNQSGSHEFMLSFDLSRLKNQTQVYSPRYF